tara:strand:+ start:70 stop:537 length:468 start_codon:yes stop_codon:yes gene_type:complete
MKIRDLKLIVYDFDGVMTDNKVYLDQNGKEIVKVCRADGLGVSGIKRIGIEQIIISTENNPVVQARASKLKIDCFQGVKNKKDCLIDYCKNNDVNLKFVGFIGNDINDQDVMGVVGLSFCPSDAHADIKSISNYLLETSGGNGVARELLDLILKQ